MHQFLYRNTLKVVSPSGLSDRQTRVSGIVNCECETHWFPFTTISVKTSRFLCTEIIHSNVQKFGLLEHSLTNFLCIILPFVSGAQTGSEV